MKSSIPIHSRNQPRLLFTALVTVAFAASIAKAGIEPEAREIAKAMAAKIGAAQTIRLTARHQLDPALGVGAKIEKGPIQITVKRPNRFFAVMRAGHETREIAFDGTTFCVMHPQLKHHAMEPLKAASIELFADRVDEKFGFRPPVAELLASDVAKQLFRDVTTARVAGSEMIGFVRCQRLHFEQPGMRSDVWVGLHDNLPRRYLLTFTDVPGDPEWDIRLSNWELNVPVDEALFSKRPAPDSQKVKMLISR